MRVRIKYLALVFLVCALGSSVKVPAQNSDRWVAFSSDAEYFRVLMPAEPKEETLNNLKTNYGDLDVRGKRYESSANGASYTVWALTNAGDSTKQRNDPDRYLDACAELVWEGLLKPARDKHPDDGRPKAMTYIKELSSKSLPGREYALTIGDVTGTTRFYVAESRMYVLLAVNCIGAEWIREPFFESFTISPNVPGRFPSEERKIDSGSTPATNDITDSQYIYKSGEVTQRARVLQKPEPTYTESARKFGVQGTVILRVVFSQHGEVTDINIFRKLPHGLTQRAVEAARRIRFIPAVKDGRPVSMWMQLEYNFNIY